MNMPNTDHTAAVRVGYGLLLVGFLGFLMWATLARLDEGVPAQGVLSVETRRKHIEHPNGGVVEQILVKEGQKVRAGEPLLVLNEVQTKSAWSAVRRQWLAARGAQARLQAEREGLTVIAYPSDMQPGHQDPDGRAAIQAQENLFRSRRDALQGEMRLLREAMDGMTRQLESLQALKVSRAQQIDLFTEQVSATRALQTAGFASRNQLLDLERQLADLRNRQAEDDAQRSLIEARLTESRLRVAQRPLDYRKEVETQLADAQKEAIVLSERISGLSDAHQRLVVKAPVSGVVVDMAVTTPGGVVKAGDRVMDLVPDADSLVVEAKIQPQYIDRVHAGLRADVHFDAYQSLSQGPLAGAIVEVVSADLLTDQRSGQSHYSLRLKLADKAASGGRAVALHSGMHCTVIIKTGERSLMTYLIRPLVRRFQGALTEV